MDFKLFFIPKGCYAYASLVKAISDMDDLSSMLQGKNKTSLSHILEIWQKLIN